MLLPSDRCRDTGLQGGAPAAKRQTPDPRPASPLSGLKAHPLPKHMVRRGRLCCISKLPPALDSRSDCPPKSGFPEIYSGVGVAAQDGGGVGGLTIPVAP